VGVTGNGAARSVLFLFAAKDAIPADTCSPSSPGRRRNGMDINDTHGLFDEYEIATIRIKSRGLIGKAGFMPGDFEDIRQEIILDLLQRLPNYDPEKSSRHTFINDLVDNKVARIFEERSAAQRDYHFAPAPLVETENEHKSLTSDYEPVTEKLLPWNRGLRILSEFELFELREDIIRVLEKLPSNLRDICIMLMQDNICTVAVETGIPKSTLIDHLKKIRNHFEISGLKIYF